MRKFLRLVQDKAQELRRLQQEPGGGRCGYEQRIHNIYIIQQLTRLELSTAVPLALEESSRGATARSVTIV
jgi:hypothetical protein